jgi:cytochrome b6-f complex iron-sulfur subunit
MEIARREFMERMAGMLAGLAVPGCASVAATRVATLNGAVRLALADYPQLTREGGYLKVQPEGAASSIYVLALEDRRFIALSPICTHLGCTVGIEGAWLVCPCHGSTYDRIGRVVRGPAERSLRQFPLAVTPDGHLIIEVGQL